MSVVSAIRFIHVILVIGNLNRRTRVVDMNHQRIGTAYLSKAADKQASRSDTKQTSRRVLGCQ
ncbi:hypothetical protein J6590_027193 [Homalodisca vitripennis]|nr:hypothetical protein J6590_027193 [Homalodisca vitripennis]